MVTKNEQENIMQYLRDRTTLKGDEIMQFERVMRIWKIFRW